MVYVECGMACDRNTINVAIGSRGFVAAMPKQYCMHLVSSVCIHT